MKYFFLSFFLFLSLSLCPIHTYDYVNDDYTEIKMNWIKMCKANKLDVESRRPFAQEKRSYARAIGEWGRAIRQGSNPTYTCVDNVHICALVHGNLTMHTRGPPTVVDRFWKKLQHPTARVPTLKAWFAIGRHLSPTLCRTPLYSI